MLIGFRLLRRGCHSTGAEYFLTPWPALDAGLPVIEASTPLAPVAPVPMTNSDVDPTPFVERTSRSGLA